MLFLMYFVSLSLTVKSVFNCCLIEKMATRVLSVIRFSHELAQNDILHLKWDNCYRDTVRNQFSVGSGVPETQDKYLRTESGVTNPMIWALNLSKD